MGWKSHKSGEWLHRFAVEMIFIHKSLKNELKRALCVFVQIAMYKNYLFFCWFCWTVIKQAHRGCGRPFLQWCSSTLMLFFTCPYILNINFMAAETVLKPVYHCPWMENQARIWRENYRSWLNEWLMRSEQLFPSGRITLTLFSGKLLTLSTIGSKQEHNQHVLCLKRCYYFSDLDFDKIPAFRSSFFSSSSSSCYGLPNSQYWWQWSVPRTFFFKVF